MNDFILQEWEEVGARVYQEEFIPMQTEVFKQDAAPTGLLAEAFEEPIKYASGPRTHNSANAIRAEQVKKIKLEQEAAERIFFTQSQIDQMLSDAFENGRSSALEESVTANNERFMEMEGNLKVILADLSEQETARTAEIEQEAISLSLDIAKKIIEHAVEINPEYIVNIIREALRLSGGAKVKKVRVSPQDMEFIQVLKVAQSIKGFDGSWSFEADASIKAGCILESSAGTIDFELDKAWERIRDKVLTLSK